MSHSSTVIGGVQLKDALRLYLVIMITLTSGAWWVRWSEMRSGTVSIYLGFVGLVIGFLVTGPYLSRLRNHVARRVVRVFLITTFLLMIQASCLGEFLPELYGFFFGVLLSLLTVVLVYEHRSKSMLTWNDAKEQQ